MEYIRAFITGGIICILVQILMDHTTLQPGRIMVILVIAGVLLGALGIYKKIEEFGGCGATVPLSGFGFSLWKGMKEAIDKHGFLGLFEGGFTAAAVGTSAALIFSYLASLIFQPKIKKIKNRNSSLRNSLFFIFLLMHCAGIRLIFFWKQEFCICCFSVTSIFSDDINFLDTFGFRTFFIGKFICFLADFNSYMSITSLFWNSAFFKIFSDDTITARVVVCRLL